jgi:hypothetical protein
MAQTTKRTLALQTQASPDTKHACGRSGSRARGPANQEDLGFVERRRRVRIIELLRILFGVIVATRASAQVPDGREPHTRRPVPESKDGRCEALSSAFVAKATKQWNRDYTLLRVEAFYSPVLDACIHAEIAEVGTYADIRELSHTFFRENPLGVALWCSNRGIDVASCAWTPTEILLSCDPDGATSVLIDRVRKYRGWVDTVPYSEWADNGFGGAPSTDKTPKKPYTKEQCTSLYNKWIAYLRGATHSRGR